MCFIFSFLNLLVFFSVLFWHVALCASFFLEPANFPSSFSFTSPALLFPHTSSSAFIIPSLRCPHRFGSPTSTSNFSQILIFKFMTFTSFSKHVFLLSAHVFFTTFLMLYLCIPACTNACWNSPWIASIFQPSVFFLCRHNVNYHPFWMLHSSLFLY